MLNAPPPQCVVSVEHPVTEKSVNSLDLDDRKGIHVHAMGRMAPQQELLCPQTAVKGVAKFFLHRFAALGRISYGTMLWSASSIIGMSKGLSPIAQGHTLCTLRSLVTKAAFSSAYTTGHSDSLPDPMT